MEMDGQKSFSYKQQNKGVWDHTTSGYLVQSFSFFVVYSDVDS
jgi:hypothetical protein